MWTLLVAALLLAESAFAQVMPGGLPPGTFISGAARDPAAVTYTGPGDIVASATAWYGLRAYNAAYATGSNKSINVRRASDNTTQDINILASGAVDIASANTFATTDATCTGTIASTTLSCVSASSTPHAGSTLTGAGITQPSYIVSCGTFTGGAGTCTLNATQTVGVGETITMQYGLYLAEIYDQSGNAVHQLQATAANQPQLLPNCGNALPCITGNNSATLSFTRVTGLSSFTAASLSIVAERISNLTTDQVIISTYNGGNQMQGAFSASTNKWNLYAGSRADATANDNALHAVQMVSNGASSIINVDGTETTVNPGGGGSSSALGLMTNGGGGPFGNGYIQEAGAWIAQFSPGNRTSLCHNQFLYWGTATSC